MNKFFYISSKDDSAEREMRVKGNERAVREDWNESAWNGMDGRVPRIRGKWVKHLKHDQKQWSK